MGILHNNSDGFPQRLLGYGANVLPVDRNNAFSDVVQPRDKRGQRRLSCTGRPDDGDKLSGLDGEAEVGEDHVVLPDVLTATRRGRFQTGHDQLVGPGVAERDVVELDAPGHVVDGTGVGIVLKRGVGVQHFKHPVERHQRREHVDAGVGQPGERHVDATHQKAHGRQLTDGEGPVDGEQATETVDQGGTNGPQQGQHGHETPSEQSRPDADVTHPGRPVGEQVKLVAAPPEQLDQQCAGHVEPFGHGRVHGSIELHTFAGDGLLDAAYPSVRQNKERGENESQKGEPPLKDEHGDQGGHERDHVGHHGSQCGGESPLRTNHVIVETVGQRAGLRAGEEGHGQPLDVVEQRHPQVVDDTLTDSRRPVPFPQPDDPLEQGGQHNGDGVDGQQTTVLVGNGPVDY